MSIDLSLPFERPFRRRLQRGDWRYPVVAGHKVGDTSAEAAASINAATLRAECLASLRARGPATPDETADRIGHSVLSIRPRFTELKRMGRIVFTGERRRNLSGRRAKVWTPVVPREAGEEG